MQMSEIERCVINKLNLVYSYCNVGFDVNNILQIGISMYLTAIDSIYSP